MGFEQDFGALDPGAQAAILKQYGSLAGVRAALESAPTPAPTPAEASPQAPPPPAGLRDDAGNPVAVGASSPVSAAPQRVGAAPGLLNVDMGKTAVGLSGGDMRIGTPAPGTPEGAAVPVSAAPKTPAEARAAATTWGGQEAGDIAAKGAPLGNKYAGNAPGESAGATANPGINWGRAGGTATIAAHEVPLVSGKRQDALTGAIDEEAKAIEGQKTAVAGSADANAEIERQRGQGLQDIAKATEDAGVDTKLRAQKSADESKAYRAHIDNFAAKLAKDKIDPNGMWDNASTGQRITWTLAQAFGAIGQAFLHTPTNQIADRLETMAAQDVAAQRANHEIGREHLADMKSMYGEALRETGNAEEAERVATGYALEAAKQQAQALTVSAQSKAQKAKGEEVVAQLSERQALIGQKKAETEIKLNPLVQARTVATGPDMSKVYASARDYIKEQAALGTIIKPDEAIRWSYKLHTGNDPLPGAGGFAGGAKETAGSKQEKLEEARTEIQGGIATIDRALESGAPAKQGPIGAMWAHVPGATDSKIDALNRDKYNAQVKSLVGAAWRMTTGGVEPKNPNLIEEQAAHYEIQPGDPLEVSRQRMLALQQALRDAGGNKGVIFDAAKSGKVLPPTFQK